MAVRSFQKVKKIITELPGVETVKSYRLSQSAVREISTAFPRCKVEAELTMNRLLDIMRQDSVDHLIVSEEEMGDIVRNISECIEREEFGTDYSRGLIGWIKDSIGVGNPDSPAGSSASDPAQLIGQFMGTEADRAKNLSAVDFLARSGKLSQFKKKLESTGETLGYPAMQAALASQNYEAYQYVNEIIGENDMTGVELPVGITGPLTGLNNYDYSLVVAAYYGAVDAVQEILLDLLRANEDDLPRIIYCALGAATRTGQAEVVRRILGLIPAEYLDNLLQNSEAVDSCADDQAFLQQMARFPVRRGEITDTLKAWYELTGNDPRAYNEPQFIYTAFNGVREGTKLDGKKMKNFVGKVMGIDTPIGIDILNEISGLGGGGNPIIMNLPLKDLKPVLELLPAGNGTEIIFEIPTGPAGETVEAAVNRGFKHPKGYLKFFEDKGYALTPDYY